MLPRNERRLHLLISKMRRLGAFEKDDIAAFDSLELRLDNAAAGSYVVREGQKVTDCCVLLQGYACRSKLTSDGRRQIVSFHVPGDVLDLQHLLLTRADHNVQLITDAKIAWIAVDALRRLALSRPNIGAALWRDTLIDASIFREWVLNVGQRPARVRVAHMLCEFAFRRAAAGLGEPERFDLPFTQEQIADATGMTAVHVNRMLGALRSEGVISQKKREVSITDWAQMKRIADFDPAYLHAAD